MNIPFDISPLNPDNVHHYEIQERNGIKFLCLWFDSSIEVTSSNWTCKIPLNLQELSFVCPHCSHVTRLKPKRCLWCLNDPDEAPASSSDNKPYLIPCLYSKDNCKDKLINIGGRACLVLGTTEAATIKNDSLSPKKYYLLSFYAPFKVASVNYDVLQYCYYDSSTGQMFENADLKKLNDYIFNQTTQHYFKFAPPWSYSKIYEIFISRRV